MQIIYNKKIRIFLMSTISAYFLYNSCKYMASIEYVNNLSNFYEYIIRKKISDNNSKKNNINIPKKKCEHYNHDNDDNDDSEHKQPEPEPYLIIDNDGEISELVFLDLGNYLNKLNITT